MIDSSLIRIFSRILNAFENDSGSPETDYASIYVYHDGNNKRRQITLARGFTEDGGNLRKVIERYIAKGGLKSKYFLSTLNKIATGTLADDKAFIKALKDASAETVMHESQDEIFEEEYMRPALNWAISNGFNFPLSVGVIVDSFLHSGSMPGWLMKKFSEKKPAQGGDEKLWITSYLQERLAWFERVTGALHNTTYRPKFFLSEIAKGNWSLSCPLRANGASIC